MAVPTWISAVGHFVSDVAGAALGFQWAEARKKTAEEVGKKLRRVLMPDREDVMKEVLYLGDEAKALHDLLVEAEGSFVMVDGRRYLENWIINMLLKIDAKDRGWVFRMLNEVLEVQGRKAFFAHLEVLNNDGVLQYLKLAKAVFEETIRKAKLGQKVKARAKAVDHWAENTAAPQVRRFGAWLESKGVRR